MSDSPPSSYYDPPNQSEINDTRPISIDDQEPCDGNDPRCGHNPDHCTCRFKSCKYFAVLWVEENNARGDKETHQVCGSHASEIYDMDVDDPQFKEDE